MDNAYFEDVYIVVSDGGANTAGVEKGIGASRAVRFNPGREGPLAIANSP